MPFCYNIDSRKRDTKSRRRTKMKDYAGMAAALYDGGWRSEDLYEIQREYKLDDFDRDEIVSWLYQYEHN